MGAILLQSEPISRVHTLSKSSTVELHLHERIFQRKQISTQLLDALARLELLLAKHNQPDQPQPSQPYSARQLTTNRPFHPEAERLISGGLDAVVMSLSDEGESAVAYIAKHNLGPLFPLSAHALRVPFHEDKSIGDIDKHLSHMSTLNQLVGMAVQLQDDIKLTNHKYMAHQLALLYQCLSLVGGNFLKYKSRVEGMFDEIKSVTTSTKEEPQLTDSQKEWLTELTTEIVGAAVFSGRTEVYAAGAPGLANYLMTA